MGRGDNVFMFGHVKFEVFIEYPDVEIQWPEVNTGMKEVGLDRARLGGWNHRKREIFTKIIYKNTEKAVGNKNTRKIQVYKVSA